MKNYRSTVYRYFDDLINANTPRIISGNILKDLLEIGLYPMQDSKYMFNKT